MNCISPSCGEEFNDLAETWYQGIWLPKSPETLVTFRLAIGLLAGIIVWEVPGT